MKEQCTRYEKAYMQTGAECEFSIESIFNIIYNKNSPTSSGSEMNCRFEHKCS